MALAAFSSDAVVGIGSMCGSVVVWVVNENFMKHIVSNCRI